MKRAFWQLFGLLFSLTVGSGAWLVAHMAMLPQPAAVTAGVAVFLAFAAGMHMFLDEHGAPGEPQMREPYTDAERRVLHEPYVPKALRHRAGAR